jgi:hypothetical protein
MNEHNTQNLTHQCAKDLVLLLVCQLLVAPPNPLATPRFFPVSIEQVSQASTLC